MIILINKLINKFKKKLKSLYNKTLITTPKCYNIIMKTLGN